MSRRPDPDRIATARRAAVIARLRSAGHPALDAERLVDAFVRESDGQPERVAWDRFDAWLGRRGRGPPGSTPM
jgi:hypothetical protein